MRGDGDQAVVDLTTLAATVRGSRYRVPRALQFAGCAWALTSPIVWTIPGGEGPGITLQNSGWVGEAPIMTRPES